MWFMGARYGLFTVPKFITVRFPKSSVVIYPVLSPSSTGRGGYVVERMSDRTCGFAGGSAVDASSETDARRLP